MLVRWSGLAVLAEPNFRRFFVGNATSLLGDGMVTVALSFAVLDLTGSPADLGYVLSARTVPRLAVLLFGGVIADRFPRRRMMIAADLTRFVGQGLVAALLISGHARIWELVVLLAVHGTATAIFNPAITGLMPAIASDDHLQQANAFRGLAISAGTIIGPAIAGVVVATTSPGWAIAVDSATFVISAMQLARLNLPAQELPHSQSFFSDLLDGWAEFRRRRWIGAYISCASFNNMFYAAFMVLGPAVALHSYGGPIAWAALVVSLGIGSLLGGIVALHIRPRRPLRTGAFGLVLFATPTIGLAGNFPVSVVAAFCLLAGAGTTLSNALAETTLQHHVDKKVLSRISSFELLGSDAAQPIGQAGTGPIAAAIGIYPTLWIAGCAQLVNAIVTLAIPTVRNLPARPDPIPAQAIEAPDPAR
jgi:MFS family permease